MRGLPTALVLLALTGHAAAEERPPVEGYEGLYPPVPARSPVPADPVRVCEGGVCAVVSRDQALADGFTLISLADDWAPRIFQDGHRPSGKLRTNSYREHFVALANDVLDHDGEKLERWEANFLELYGIPPSISLYVKRWRKDRESAECYEEVDFERIATFEGRVRFRGQPNAWQERRKRFWVQVRKLMKRRKVETPEDLEAADERAADIVGKWREAQHRVDMVSNVQKRLKCDRLWSPFRRIKPGREGRITQEAVGRFERKHRIFGYGHIQKETLQSLALPPDELNHRGLLRVLAERIVSAAGIIEDGSADGVPDLAREYTDLFAREMGIAEPGPALEFFDRLVTYEGVEVGVRLPPRPAWYSDHMDLTLTIDRGDVWYDFPYDDRGRRRRQKRKSRPRVTLSVVHEGEIKPLVRWRTTIGAWRKEMVEDGYVYLKYKNSDVGPRLMRKIIAAPVWIPPESTPLKELIKKKREHKRSRKRVWVVNYDEMGPGYKSAYGLVAGYLVEHRCRRDGSKCWDVDHGIRMHGTADYMSILARFSHGCHRLYNHLAIRLYGFLLAHRPHTVHGEGVLDYEREFEVTPKGEEEPMPFQIELATRGFRYMLDPPLPVEVLEGKVMGEIEEPIEEYMRIPSREYAPDAWIPLEGGLAVPPPDAGAAGDDGADAGVAEVPAAGADAGVLEPPP